MKLTLETGGMMSNIRRALITLAIMCGLIAGVTAPASAAPAAHHSAASVVASNQVAQGFCFDSRPYFSGADMGVHISHCDVQAIIAGGDIISWLTGVIGVFDPPFQLIAASLQLNKMVLEGYDRGNGVYVVKSALTNLTRMWSA